jgi:RimJ/RimL family protein N-acetyltransferase
MQSRRVRLTPIGEQHRAFLYQLMTSPGAGGRVRFAGATPSPDKMAATLWDSVLAQFIIEGMQSGQPLGLVAITSPNFRDGYAYLSAIATPALQGKGLVTEGVLLGFHYAFSTWPFRKLYMEAAEDSYERFVSGLGVFFREEGLLRQHVFWNGRFLDVTILAVYREAWLEHKQHYLSRFASADDRPEPVDTRRNQRLGMMQDLETVRDTL